MECTVATKIRL